MRAPISALPDGAGPVSTAGEWAAEGQIWAADAASSVTNLDVPSAAPSCAGIRLPIHRQRIGKRIGKGSLSLSHRHSLSALASQPPTPIVPQCVGGWEVKGWWWDREREEKNRRKKTKVQKQKRKKMKRKKRKNKNKRQRRSEISDRKSKGKPAENVGVDGRK